jgi:hypothetical protein
MHGPPNSHSVLSPVNFNKHYAREVSHRVLGRRGLLVKRWRMKHVLVATVLLAIELALGLGIIGTPAIIVAAVVLLGGNQRLGMRLQVAALYLCVSALTFTWLVYNVHVAKRRAIPVIAACKQFKAEHNRYPTQLDELIPATLTELPNARNTLVAKRFGYDATRPTLYFPAMFHGVFFYDFQTDSWTTND